MLKPGRSTMNASNGQPRSQIARAARPHTRFPLALLVALSACGGISIAPPDGGSSAGGHTGAGGASGTGGKTGTGTGGQIGAGTGGQIAAGTGGQTGAGGAGTGGKTGTGGGSGTGGKTGAGGGRADGGGVCNVFCMTGRNCCGGACVNEQNDPMNCGTCGKVCEGATPLCSGGQCVTPPCDSTPGVCAANALCCGSSCCAPGQLCCQVDGPISGGPPGCFTPTADQKTCPQGCAPLCVSDRNQKKNITPADTGEVLRRVSRLPIALWTYRAEPDGVRHLGPMAQDFRASFGLGDDDRTYNSID